MDYLTKECFGCKGPLAGEVGVYYCDTCVAAQLRAHRATMIAFDEFHAWADSVGRKPLASDALAPRDADV